MAPKNKQQQQQLTKAEKKASNGEATGKHQKSSSKEQNTNRSIAEQEDREETKAEASDRMTADKSSKTEVEEPKAKSNGEKRKKDGAPSSSEANKKARRGRSTPKSTTTGVQVMNYLLSSSSHHLCHPKDEADGGKRTYSGNIPLTPFEELVSALILSRPISHNLGQRAIRTLLNAPYSFRSPKTVTDAGEEKVHKALEDARTQHKAKTATQLIGASRVVVDQFCTDGKGNDAELDKLRGIARKGLDELREVLTGQIKGLGTTGVDIFVRRVQGVWEECYPFIDERTQASVEKLGLPSDATELSKLIDEKWKELKVPKELAGSEQKKKKLVFVTILERAIGADLEGNCDEVLDVAGSA